VRPHKNLNRVLSISGNAARQFLVSGINMIIPLLVIHFTSKKTWGAFVPVLLYVLIVIPVINWGNKEFLLRKFSMEPAGIKSYYSQILFTRLPLLILMSCVGFFCFPLSFGCFILLWILGRYFTHSAEALVIYEKKFNESVWIEVWCFILFCLLFYWIRDNADLYLLLIVYSLYQFIRGCSFFILFRRFFNAGALKIDWRYYQNSLPFFLLSLLGFLSSKADVYIINHYADREIVANYQVINGLFVFIMSMAGFIYAPFTKNIYRNNPQVIEKTKQLLAASGLLIIPVSLMAVHYILKYYLDIEYSFLFYAVAFFYIYPSYAYGIEIISLFKLGQERKVVGYLFSGIVINILLSWLLLGSGYGIIGVLSGSAFSQWVLLLLFRRQRHGNNFKST
jgi:O-antigen/teichoic acid export membrane protein